MNIKLTTYKQSASPSSHEGLFAWVSKGSSPGETPGVYEPRRAIYKPRPDVRLSAQRTCPHVRGASQTEAKLVRKLKIFPEWENYNNPI